MSCTPGRCAVAARMERSIRHSLFRNHPMSIKCAGCLEHLGFGTVEGYAGDVDYPICGDGMEVVLAREQERLTEAEAHDVTFPRFLHRLNADHSGEAASCPTDVRRGGASAIAEPESGSQADHDTMAPLLAGRSRSDHAPHKDSRQVDSTPALPPGSYGDGLHHTHQCLACSLTYPCREEHPRDVPLLVRDVVAMCPDRERY